MADIASIPSDGSSVAGRIADPLPSRTFTVTLGPAAGGEVGHITLPFDARTVFGRGRPPLYVEVNSHRFRSTVAVMGGEAFVPFRRSHRAAAGVGDGDTFIVTLTLDTDLRTVDAPKDLCAALEAAGAGGRWTALNFTHRREHVEAIEGARKPETRARRVAKCVAMLA